MLNFLRGGRYTIRKILKKDSFAVTCLAWDQLLLQQVIVRECRRAGAAKKDFIKEGGILFCQYDWNGLAAVRDVFTEKERAYLVTEYLGGPTLREYLKKLPRRRLSPERALAILLPVMETLAFLHSVGLIHGNVTLDTLRFDESDHLKLTGAGEFLYRMKRGVLPRPGKLLPPESVSVRYPFLYGKNYRTSIPDDVSYTEGSRCPYQGPWTDVFGICQVLYTAVTGCYNPRKGAALSEVDEKLTDILIQGMSTSIRERCFCMETLMERLNMDTSGVHSVDAGIREKWGELWLHLSMMPDSSPGILGRSLFTKRQKKILFRLTLSVLLFTIVSAGLLHIYAAAHPKEVLEYHIKKDREKLSAQTPEAVNKHSDTYETLKEIAVSKGKATEYDNLTDYQLSRKTVKKYKLRSNEYQPFVIKKDTLLEAVEYWLSQDLGTPSSLDWSADIRISTGELKSLKLSCYELDTWEFQTMEEESVEASEEKEGTDSSSEAASLDSSLKISYDLLSEAVISLKIFSTREDCSIIMKNILPLLVPEAYLTEEEINGLFDEESDSSGSTYIEHGKYQLYLSKSAAFNKWTLSVSSYLLGDSSDEEYAGSVSRSSDEYEEYLEFLEKNAVSVQEENGSTTYTLNAETVREWGESSNCWLLDVTAEEFLEDLKEKGYTPEFRDSKEDICAELSSYGIVKTYFLKRDTYTLDHQEIGLIYDILSEKLRYIVLYDLENDAEQLSGTAVEIAGILSEDVGSDLPALKEEYLSCLETYMEKTEEGSTGYYAGGNYADCSFVLGDKLDDQYYYFYFLRYGLPDTILSDSYPPYRF